MNKVYKSKPASQQELTLYCILGEAICAIQHLEDALSHSIAIKKSKTRKRSEGNKLLEEHRSYTLGRAIGIAEKAGLFPEPLQEQLKELLSERNWLVHKSIAHNRDDWDLNISREKLILRIKSITTQAHNLQQSIEGDLIEFAEANGVDMSLVKAEIKKHYADVKPDP